METVKYLVKYPTKKYSEFNDYSEFLNKIDSKGDLVHFVDFFEYFQQNLLDFNWGLHLKKLKPTIKIKSPNSSIYLKNQLTYKTYILVCYPYPKKANRYLSVVCTNIDKQVFENLWCLKNNNNSIIWLVDGNAANIIGSSPKEPRGREIVKITSNYKDFLNFDYTNFAKSTVGFYELLEDEKSLINKINTINNIKF